MSRTPKNPTGNFQNGRTAKEPTTTSRLGCRSFWRFEIGLWHLNDLEVGRLEVGSYWSRIVSERASVVTSPLAMSITRTAWLLVSATWSRPATAAMPPGS
jgi:hypothetical protein